ncbi:MAG: hypothetical protein ACLQMF_04045 [Rectinemataceae bacterium]
MTATLDGALMRRVLVAAFPDSAAESGSDIPPSFMYLPQSHAQALDPDVSIVSGIRGAGKTFWWRALSEESFRSYLAGVFGLKQYENIQVAQGFGTIPQDAYPNKETIRRLVSQKIRTEDIWRAIVLSTLEPTGEKKRESDWGKRVQRITADSQFFDREMQEHDERCRRSGTKILVIFDALDRLADTWNEIRPIAKALFKVALDIRSYGSIRPKLFVRSDMLEDREIISFPDASKLLARKLDLLWRKTDLYALIFQRLGNVVAGDSEFRKFCADQFGLEWDRSPGRETWILPEKLRYDEKYQAGLFAAIAGPKMAKGEKGYKRGIPYSWLITHLIDGREQISPRSVFSALKTAAEQTPDEEWNYPLDPKALSKGVSEASGNRRNEITEDYPWVNDSLKPLKGLTVPCEQHEVVETWRKAGVIELLGQMKDDDEVKLPPRQLARGEEGVIEDLIELGVFSRLGDGRIQMSDIFRIGFGIKRKGGVKPLRSG